MADTLFLVAGGIAVAALLPVFARFVVGPHSADRVVAFDIMTIISISLLIFIAVIAGRSIYIDVALVYGLLSFLGVIVVARYIERGL